MLYVQVADQVTGAETYEREFGNLKLIKDNYPKYVVTLDPNVVLIHDSGIVACTARDFLLGEFSIHKMLASGERITGSYLKC